MLGEHTRLTSRISFCLLASPSDVQSLISCSLVKGLLSDVLYSYHYLLISLRYRLSVGTNEKIQLSSLIAAFQVTRDLIVSEA